MNPSQKLEHLERRAEPATPSTRPFARAPPPVTLPGLGTGLTVLPPDSRTDDLVTGTVYETRDNIEAGAGLGKR